LILTSTVKVIETCEKDKLSMKEIVTKPNIKKKLKFMGAVGIATGYWLEG
jgi:hypothetical protein